MLTIIATTALAAFLLFGLPRIAKAAKQHKDKLREAIRLRELSGEAARVLIADDRVPESVVYFVCWFQTNIGGYALARRFTRDILVGEVQRARSSTGDSSFALMRDLDKLGVQQSKAFQSMVGFGMLSCAYSDPLLSKYHVNLWEASVKEEAFRPRVKNIVYHEESAIPSREEAKAVAADLDRRYIARKRHADELCAA